MCPVILTSRSRVDGCSFIEMFNFSSGAAAPLYEVRTMHAFNQLIGHVKFLNAQYGNVYYRGVNGLFDNVRPSIMRRRNHGEASDLKRLLSSICHHDFFKKSLKLTPIPRPVTKSDYFLVNKVERENKNCVEALLQHYSGNTRFLDVVDNHWIALWMGLHSFVMHGKGFKYCECVKREMSIGSVYEASHKDMLSFKNALHAENIYEYVILLAMPFAKTISSRGIVESDEFVEVDLRKALPSHYLRPHAQHALVVKRTDKSNTMKTASFYDMSSQVVAILKIRIDLASQWLGNGNLLSPANLFPSPSVDQGYNNLLMNSELFTYPFEIVRYY